MSAPLGNRFWELRSRHGRKPIFSTPEDLWKACCDYFAWVEENPLKEEKVFSATEGIRRAEISKMRAMTISGLCFFLGIARETWSDYGRKEDFSDIVREAEAVIYEQKFSGAAADLLNANIIARDLGLADKKEHTGKVTLEDLLTEGDE
ncbi:MAG: DNA-packaging protein [Desulfuromonadales bacterium]|nr:DNA-packaging protein [Desulfuromonadales bacterium]